jgi:hypothetical protein
MSVQTNRLLAASFCAVSLAACALTGCCRQCDSKCMPRGPWESPTTQAMRALLLVNTPELHILRVDGRNVNPSCVGEGGVREYHLPVGERRVTASFRYQAPVSGGLIGAVEGRPLTLTRRFIAGHEYVAVYHEHPYPKPDAESLLEKVAVTLFAPQDRYWSLDIVDLADIGPDSEPEIRRAQVYSSLIKEDSADLGRVEF